MVKEWLKPLADPLLVEATTHVSYLVLPDKDLRMYEVILAGTVMSANQQSTNQAGQSKSNTEHKATGIKTDDSARNQCRCILWISEPLV